MKIKPYCHLVDTELILLVFKKNTEPDSSIQNLTNPLVELRSVFHIIAKSAGVSSSKRPKTALTAQFSEIVFSNLLKKNMKYCTKHEG